MKTKKQMGWLGTMTAVAVLAGALTLTGAASAQDMMPKYDYSKVDVMMQNGMELVPLRQVAESLGFKVSWNGQNRSVTLGMGMGMGDGMMGDGMKDGGMMGDEGMGDGMKDGGMMGDDSMKDGMMNGKGRLLMIMIGSNMATIDGKSVELDYAPMIMHDKTYVSKAFVDMYLLGGM
ncbi:copper amine oxidase N-terminal domain-containing protein [Paenibacillus athensensis]|uniref:Copper amine oxidase-like N-terminal domain-containing protein n=1 Tax=Paenibacillus athensensis TaxID=1967502 RepID=A0A4Y8PYZ1_9BACL|nr:copper amine oxidase N-terminal domain-containing protein [Paenibacillus athensensis]MCD1259943.1 copper amine oxidase N-terminal domain-containing protein [Paenibacillus athensensis]